MFYIIINHIVILISIIFFILCSLASVKRLQIYKKIKVLSFITKYHAVYAWLFLIFSFIHGILAGNAPAAISGKIAWIMMCLLMILAYLKKKMSVSLWKKIHITLSIVLTIGILAHIIHAVIL